jgi:thioredoxin reductase
VSDRDCNIRNLYLAFETNTNNPFLCILSVCRSVDEYQNTAAKGVYALGDVCGKIELTPMAIAAGRRLADRSNRHASLHSDD